MKKILSIVFGFAFAVSGFAQSGDPLPPFTPAIPLCTATTPQNGTSEVQAFTISALQAATIQFSFQGKTATLTLSGTEADNAAISSEFKTSLESMATIGGSNTSVATTGTAARVVAVTFTGTKANLALPQISGTVTSGSLTLTGTTTTQGITADGRSTPKGTLIINKGAATLYINQGSFPSPSWVKVGP